MFMRVGMRGWIGTVFISMLPVAQYSSTRGAIAGSERGEGCW